MMMDKEKYEGEGMSINNQGYNEANALTIRLDTQQVLDRIKSFLEGTEEKLVIDNKTKEPRIVREQIVERKVNAQGVYGIMAWLQHTVNTQVVQGNIQDWAELDNYVYTYRMDLSEYIMKNLINWDVADEDYNGIIDMIMLQVKPFMSRLVNNKERESYSNTIKHSETSGHTLKQKGGDWKIRGTRT